MTKLPKLVHGKTYTEYTILTVEVTYRCRKGFQLVGRRKRKCTYGSVLPGEAPVCRCEFDNGVQQHYL